MFYATDGLTCDTFSIGNLQVIDKYSCITDNLLDPERRRDYGDRAADKVFKESLEKKAMPGLPAGHPVHTYMLENRAAEEILDEMKKIEDPLKERDRLLSLLGRLSEIDRHYVRKENQLFPVLEAKGISGPSKVMWALHDDIRMMMKDVKARTQNSTITEKAVKTLVHMINDMIYKEEHILFPMVLETLDEDDWTRVRQGEDEIGYAWIKPLDEWRPLGDKSHLYRT